MESQNTIVEVPNLSTSDLIKHLGLERVFRRVGFSIDAWDFVRDERGKSYEVRVLSPGISMTPREARKHFPDGFTGNPAAFVVWAAQRLPEGYHVTVPEDDQLFTLDRRRFFAPHFMRSHGSAQEGFFGLTGNDVDNVWLPHWSYVVFRETLSVAAAVALAVPKTRAA